MDAVSSERVLNPPEAGVTVCCRCKTPADAFASEMDWRDTTVACRAPCIDAESRHRADPKAWLRRALAAARWDYNRDTQTRPLPDLCP